MKYRRGLLAVLVVALGFRVPAAAQTTYSFTPSTAVVFAPAASPGIKNLVVTPGPGTITISFLDELNNRVSGVVTAVAPASASGILSGGIMNLNPAANFSLRSTITGASQVNLSLSDTRCQGSTATVTCSFGFLNFAPTGDVFISTTIEILTRGAGGAPLRAYAAGVNYFWKPVAPTTTCPASIAPGPQPSGKETAVPGLAVACKDEISIDLALPKPATNPIAAIATALPAFCATGKFSLTEKGNGKAKIVLVVVDDKERTIARSTPSNVFSPGKDQEWGAGCLNAQFVTEAKAFQDLRNELLWPFTGATDFKEPADFVLGKLRLYAALVDAVTALPIVFSEPVEYNIIPGGKLKSSKFRVVSNGVSTVMPPNTVLPNFSFFDDSKGRPNFGREIAALANATLGVATSAGQFYLDLEVEFPGDIGDLDLNFSATAIDGGDAPVSLHSNSVNLKKGLNTVSFKITGDLSGAISVVTFTPVIGLPNGQKIFLPEIYLRVNSMSILSISPDNKKCDPTLLSECFEVDAKTTVKAKVAVALAKPVGNVYSQRTEIGRAEAAIRSEGPFEISGVPLIDGQVTVFDHQFAAGPFSDDTSSFRMTYAMRNCATPPDVCAVVLEVHRRFLSKDIREAGNLASAALRGLKGAGQNAISSIRVAGTTPVLNKLDGILNAPRQNAQAVEPELLWLGASWQFSPTYPRNGTFSSALTLKYNVDMYPDDPNFIESKIQIASVDSSGGLHVYPTTLNMTTKEATAQLDGLDPYYGLAMVGPFSRTPLMLASAPSGYAIVNAGSQATNLQLANVTSEGEGAIASSTLNSLNTVRADASGWVKAWTDSPSVAGASWQESGKLLAVGPATKPDQNFLLPGMEYTSRKTVELHLANPASLEAVVSVTLVKADGSAQGSYEVTLRPSGSLRAPLKSLFPSLTAGFIGYALIKSRVPIVASALVKTALTMSFVAAQPVNFSTLAVTGRYAPLVADANVTGVVHLVNTGKAAQVTLRARGANGSVLGQDVRVNVAAGQQYTSSLNDLFGVTGIASVTFTSSVTGVFGDLVSADSSFLSAYSVSLPFTDDSSLNAVLPYTPGGTVVPVFNPGSTAANVTVTPYSANGAAGAASATSVAAGARALIAVQSSGFVVVRSTAPVLAAALVTSTAGGIAGYGAVPIGAAAMGGGGGSTGPIPAASAAGVLNAASFKGGGVAPGELVTIFGSNMGPAALSTLVLDAQGRVATTLNGARVLFDGVAAPVIYTLAGQGSVIVPYSVAGRASTQMVVEYQGRQSTAVSVPVVAAAPGLFSANSSGTGPGAILNQNGSLNTAQNPAAVGSVIALYGTGEGTVTPSVADGAVNSAVFPKPVLPVTMTIGGRAANVLYAGAAPGLVAGVLQINATIPAGLSGGAQAVVVNVGSFASQAGLTVAVAGTVSVAPVIDVTPTALDFGQVTVGQTRDVTLTVRNQGTAALTISTISGTNPRITSVGIAAPITLAAGASQNLTFRFSPNTAGAQTAVIQIISNDPARPTLAVNVTGTGVTGTGALPTIALGQTVTGTLSSATTRRSTNCQLCYADVYQLTITAATRIVVAMNSTAFDAFINLLDENGNIIGSNDDGGGGTNARLSGTIQPGLYRIEATTANDRETGAYTLSVTTTQ